MVTHHNTGLANFYRRVYPIAALVILAFEAWALVIQLGNTGLKVTEYAFIIVWIFAAAASVLLLILKDKAHPAIAVLLCALAVVSVLPAVGYHALPVAVQTNRLENLLSSEGMLKDGKLIPAAAEPERVVREGITDAVNFLAYAEDAKLPAWFDTDLGQGDVFKSKLGFKQIWPKSEGTDGETSYNWTSLSLPPGTVDISDYRWAVNVQNAEKTGDSIVITGSRGAYTVNWITDTANGMPSIRITLGDSVILEQDLSAFMDEIAEKYPPGQTKAQTESLEDMCLRMETPEIAILLIFNNIEITEKGDGANESYWLNLGALYLNEKT